MKTLSVCTRACVRVREREKERERERESVCVCVNVKATYSLHKFSPLSEKKAE